MNFQSPPALVLLATVCLALPATAQHPNDECVNAAPIAGVGLFPFDNTGATDSGTSGLNCSGAIGPGGDTIPDDIWFRWTAPSAGDFRISTCNMSLTLDTKLAVYDGDDCVTSMVVDCNDDDGNCSNFSSIIFLTGAVSGQAYLVQLGTWAGGALPFIQGAGDMEIIMMSPPVGGMNDDCANATVIAGTGTFAFNNQGATTDGVGDPLCDKFGTDQISSDVWYLWTAPASGQFRAETCNLTMHDTKMAVYTNQACPPTLPLDCNDDDPVCALQSAISWNAISGFDYLIRIGSFSATAQGSGDFEITQTGGPPVIGTNYCTSLVNSSGNLAVISATGDTSVFAQTLTLQSSGMPPGVNGIFYYGTTDILALFGDGFRCVGGAVQRLPFNSADGSGTMTDPDVFSNPMNNLPIAPMQTLYFQAWFRDPAAMMNGFNLSDGVEIAFVP